MNNGVMMICMNYTVDFNMKVTNEQLGAVYLEVDGLDKERFKELIKGMEVYKGIDFNLRYIENYSSHETDPFEWIDSNGASYESKKITLDELEQLLNPVTTPQPTHFAISPEDYTEFMKWKGEKIEDKKNKYNLDYCMQTTGVWRCGSYPHWEVKEDIKELHGVDHNNKEYIMLLIDNQCIFLGTKNY